MNNFKNILEEININSDNGIIIGSGVLQALKIRDSKDIDIVVDEDTYKKLKDSNNFKTEIVYGQEVLKNEIFEIGREWFVLGKPYKFEDLKEPSTIIDDVRYITLDFLYQVKQSWIKQEKPRQKDIDDVKLIELYIKP